VISLTAERFDAESGAPSLDIVVDTVLKGIWRAGLKARVQIVKLSMVVAGSTKIIVP